MQRPSLTARAVTVTAAAATLLAGAAATTAAAATKPASQNSSPRLVFSARQIVFGAKLTHRFTPAGSRNAKSEPLTSPDDLTAMGGFLFTAFQNGVGPQGEPSTSGNRDSTIVEFTARGRVVGQWDIRGKCDGLTADPAWHRLIATVNEDAHSSLYTIQPGHHRGAVSHYQYNRPLPHKGGTDAISVIGRVVVVSASAPGTTGAAAPQAGYPAAYVLTFSSAKKIATIHPVFSDEAKARVANAGAHGRVVRLALTDPDSNAVVPADARRFARNFELTSQGDKEQVYLGRSGLRVLRLSQAVDDTAWAVTRHGRFYATDQTADTVDVVTGRFAVGIPVVVVTPCDANGAPATCPVPPKFPPNYLGLLNPWTGRVSRVAVRGASLQPHGLIFAG